MKRRGRCVICRKYFTVDRRVGARQVTCSAPECRRARKRATDRRWRREHPEYHRHYRRQHPDRRDRRDYARRYRASDPDHRARNTEHVRAHRKRIAALRLRVSPESREIRVILRDERGYVPIADVSTERTEIIVTLAAAKAYRNYPDAGAEAPM